MSFLTNKTMVHFYNKFLSHHLSTKIHAKAAKNDILLMIAPGSYPLFSGQLSHGDDPTASGSIPIPTKVDQVISYKWNYGVPISRGPHTLPQCNPLIFFRHFWARGPEITPVTFFTIGSGPAKDMYSNYFRHGFRGD